VYWTVGARYIPIYIEQDCDEYLHERSPLEVVDEDLLETFPGVDRVVAEALQPRERRRVQSHREVDDLGDVGAPCDFNGGGVAT
jgi:hypothetical protein